MVIFDSQSFITSANADYIPLPPFGDCQVKLRANSRYGGNDPTQWPQPYNSYHSHLAAIPRPNTLSDHQIIWWIPTIGDFSCTPLGGPVSGLGKLCQQRYNQLRTSVIFSQPLCNKIPRISSSWMKFSCYPTIHQVDPTGPWSTQLCPNALSSCQIRCPRLAEGMAPCLCYDLIDLWRKTRSVIRCCSLLLVLRTPLFKAEDVGVKLCRFLGYKV